jgi:hypothetical protein
MDIVAVLTKVVQEQQQTIETLNKGREPGTHPIFLSISTCNLHVSDHSVRSQVQEEVYRVEYGFKETM